MGTRVVTACAKSNESDIASQLLDKRAALRSDRLDAPDDSEAALDNGELMECEQNALVAHEVTLLSAVEESIVAWAQPDLNAATSTVIAYRLSEAGRLREAD